MSDILPFRKTTQPQDLVLRFLSSLGHKRDADFYLNFFTSLKPESFAILVIDQEIAEEELDAVLFEVRYLVRLSLFPIILIQTKADSIKKFEDDPLLKKSGFTNGILSDDYTLEEKFNLIHERIKRRSLPLLRLDPEEDASLLVTQLAKKMLTSRVIWLRKAGGITMGEQVANIINLRFDSEKLQTYALATEYDKSIIHFANAVITNTPHRITVSVVSPRDLLKELFTVKGAGTLLQRGSLINEFLASQSIDEESLKNLLELSFEKNLRADFFNTTFDKYYIEENYMGAALIKNFSAGAYLSKFAVGTEARGLGIGRDLWNRMTHLHKQIFWRSRPDKFINQWYIKQCDGMHRTSDWIVFWKGIPTDQIQNVIAFALDQPIDFVDSTPKESE